MFLDKCNVNINAITYYGIISVIKKHYITDDLEMKPPLITNMMQRKDISKYIFKYFIQKVEKDNFVKGIVKWEHKLDTELDGSMLFNDIYRITNDTKLRNFQFKLLHHILPNNKLLTQNGNKKTAHYVISVTKKKIPSYTICGAGTWQRDFGLLLISGFHQL
jgi:hypothetical protein